MRSAAYNLVVTTSPQSPTTRRAVGRARLVCAAAYLICLSAFFLTLKVLPSSLVSGAFERVVVADVVATFVIFGFSVGFRNSSFYDAYWSVLPIVMTGWWLLQSGLRSAGWPRAVVVLGLVSIWGCRLTFNWLRHWRGLEHEDWRYRDLKEKTGAFYPVVNLLGIHLFPTAIVLAGLYPVFRAMNSPAPFGYLDGIATLVTALAILIETVADRQLHDFVASKPDPKSYLSDGLWSWSRHPNYFGEASFWWGLALFGLAATPGFQPMIMAGATAMTAMFFGISIPMIDARMVARRPSYREHMKRVSRLIPFPPRS